MTNPPVPNLPRSNAPWKSPEHALERPREVLLWWLWLLRRLGFPEPDPFWRTTAQVNWRERVSFGRRFLCLYLGHDFVERQVRTNPKHGEPGWPGWSLTHRRDCDRCGWEGPWVK